MGNHLAASPNIPPSVSGSLVSPPPPPVASKEVTEEKRSDEGDTKNPGTMEDLHKKTRDVFPMVFEGARVIINKGLSNHFQISHTMNMSSLTPPGYRFGATYVGTKYVGPGEAYPVFLGDVDPSGNLNANILHQFNSRVKTKLVAQIQDSRCVATQMTTDYKGDDYTASLTLGNLDIVNSSGIAVGHYLQRVYPKVDLGTEIAYQYGPQIPGGGMAVLSVAGRYTPTPNHVISGTLSSSSLHVSYFLKSNENLQVGVEVETNMRMQESVATFGYQIDLPRANLLFKGSVDSNYQVSGVLEKKLLPLPFTFMLSGHIQHGYKNSSYRFGVGLLLG